MTVEVAEDGLSGLQMARDANPHAVLIATDVPRCNGFIVSRLLKFDKTYQNLPVIILANNDIEKEPARQVGADLFFEKTAPIEKIVNDVRSFLESLTVSGAGRREYEP